MPRVSSTSPVAGTSSRLFTPERRRSRGPGRARRDRPTRRAARRSRVDAAEAAGRHHADPSRRQTASVPPTVVAPSALWTQHAARSRGPTLRASAPARRTSSSSSVEPDADLAVDDADRRRNRAGRADAPLGLRPTLAPSPAGKPCATSVVSSATTPRPSHSASRTSPVAGGALGPTGIAPSLGRSARQPRGRPRAPPTRKPAASASPAPVESTTAAGRGAAPRPSQTTHPAGPRLRTQIARGQRRPGPPPRHRSRTRRRARARRRARGTREARTSRSRRRREVDADRVPARERRARGGPPRRSARAAARSRTGAARRSPRAMPARLIGASPGATPRSDAIVRRPPARRATRRRLATGRTGPTISTPRALRLRSASSPPRRRRACRRPRLRAERDRPRRDVGGLAASASRVVAGASLPASSGAEAHDHVEQEISEGADEHAHLPRPAGTVAAWTATRALEPPALVPARRAGRRLGRARRGAAPRRPAARRRAPAGLAAFEDAPCYREASSARSAARVARGARSRDERRVEVDVGIAELELACPRSITRARPARNRPRAPLGSRVRIDEERPEGSRLELRRRAAGARSGIVSAGRRCCVARVEHPDAAPERLRRVSSVASASFGSARGTTCCEMRAAPLPRAEVERVVAEEDVVRRARRREPRRGVRRARRRARSGSPLEEQRRLAAAQATSADDQRGERDDGQPHERCRGARRATSGTATSVAKNGSAKIRWRDSGEAELPSRADEEQRRRRDRRSADEQRAARRAGARAGRARRRRAASATDERDGPAGR